VNRRSAQQVVALRRCTNKTGVPGRAEDAGGIPRGNYFLLLPDVDEEDEEDEDEPVFVEPDVEPFVIVPVDEVFAVVGCFAMMSA
jgi:hypothetical protein